MGIQSHIIATVAIKFSSKNIAFHSDSILYKVNRVKADAAWSLGMVK